MYQPIQVLIAQLIALFQDRLLKARSAPTAGATTVEYIIMVLLGITIAGIVAAAITGFVTGKIGELG